MSDIYYVDIQDSINKCEDRLISIVDKYHNVGEGTSTPIHEAERSRAKDEIKNLCRAIEHRIELLLYIKEMIKGFDWSKYHRFEY